MQKSFVIRPIVFSDAAVIARINIDAWRETYSGLIAQSTLNSMGYEEYLAKWLRILDPMNATDRFGFVAESDNKIVGYVSSGKTRGEDSIYEGELYALYLLKEYHGWGIGKALFLKAVEAMATNNISSFKLYVLKENAIGRSFYDRFAPEEITDAQFKIDENIYCDLCYGWKSIEKVLR
jgi:ribosomal protein S18 acetylase RimI-like enzyme